MKKLKVPIPPVHTSQTSHYLDDIWRRCHIDQSLFWGLIVLSGIGLLILYSAANEDNALELRQLLRLGIAFTIMFLFAQVPPVKYKQWAPWLYGIGLILLLAVLVIGQIGKGAQRWLDLGVVSFQPSELMKLAMPMMIAWSLSDVSLPPKLPRILWIGVMILLPVLMIAKQPDLGTALMIAVSGATVLFLSGLGWRLIFLLLTAIGAVTPVLWHFLHDYQRQRVLTFLDPERDPLGAGYHIIQSKIAIGSGGLFGKGWMQGTQSHLDFLPEHATDFIFAVCGEEFGLIGCAILVLVYLVIVSRGLFIAVRAQDTFSRLLAGSITTTFFLSVFVNMGMVIGILPVVGLPLPLVSYGGTSMVTLMASFGLLMSVQTHRNLVSN